MLKPLKGKVILKTNKEKKNKSGIILTGDYETDNIIAKVYSTSYMDNDVEIYKGENVIISKFAGNKIEYNNEEYIVVDIKDILAIVKEER